MILAFVAATLAGLVLSAVYYTLLTDREPERSSPGPSTAMVVVVELVRSAAIAGLIAGLVSSADWTTPLDGALLGLALWTLPVVLLVGSIVHEGTGRRSALVHAGDWLIKLVVIGLIIGSLA